MISTDHRWTLWIAAGRRPRFREEIAMAAVQTAAVVKVEEFVGSSPTSFSDAVRNVVRRASQTLRNIRGVEVISSNAEVGSDGELALYKVNCKVAFIVEDHSGGDAPAEGCRAAAPRDRPRGSDG